MSIAVLWKNKKKKMKKKNVNLSSAEFAQRAIKVNSIGGVLINRLDYDKHKVWLQLWLLQIS